MTETNVQKPKSEFTRASLTAAFAASVGMFVGSTPMVSATASQFMTPLAEEFDLSRTAVSAILLTSPLTVALFAPIGGRLMDRFGVRNVIIPVVIAFLLGNIALYFSGAAWHVVVLYVFLGICGSVHAYPAYTKVVSMWFARHRGIMMGLMIAFGSGLGATIVPQFVRHWIEDYGWRGAYLGISAIIAFWGLPILYLFLREPARDKTSDSKTEAGVSIDGLTRPEAMRKREFWTILLAIFLGPMAIVGTVGHSVPMLIERGFDSASATTALSFIYIGGMIGQLSAGFLLDRVNTPKIVLPFFLAACCGAIIMHTTTDPVLLLAGGALLGCGQGSELTITAFLAGRYFGLKAYGAIYGALFASACVGVGAGLMSMGFVHDLTGSYDVMRYVLPANLVIVILLLSSLGPYKYKRPSQNPTPAEPAPAPT